MLNIKPNICEIFLFWTELSCVHFSWILVNSAVVPWKESVLLEFVFLFVVLKCWWKKDANRSDPQHMLFSLCITKLNTSCLIHCYTGLLLKNIGSGQVLVAVFVKMLQNRFKQTVTTVTANITLFLSVDISQMIGVLNSCNRVVAQLLSETMMVSGNVGGAVTMLDNFNLGSLWICVGCTLWFKRFKNMDRPEKKFRNISESVLCNSIYKRVWHKINTLSRQKRPALVW